MDMQAFPGRKAAWIESEEVVQVSVDRKVLGALLGAAGAMGVENRGAARPLSFQAVYDREGRHEIDAQVFRSERGLVVVVQDDLFRCEDRFYLVINGKTTTFTIREIRPATRASDQPQTRVLYLSLP